MEVPDPPDPVEPIAASVQHNRPGPGVVDGDGIFQLSVSGEYHVQDNLTVPHSSALSSPAEQRIDEVPARSVEMHRSRSSNLQVYYQNVGGLNCCVDEYLIACSDESYDVIVFTETWLNDRTLSSQIFGSNYDVFRTDRSPNNSLKSSGGGVLIAVQRHLKAQLIDCNSWESVEQVWVMLKLAGYSLFLCAVYLPPDRTRDRTLIDAHCDSVKEITSRAHPADEIVIIGDFNFPGLRWSSASDGFLYANPVLSSFHDGINCLLDSYSVSLLRQINPIKNENGRSLDLCFVSSTDYAPDIRNAASPLVKFVAHHPPLHLSLEVDRETNTYSVPEDVCYNFKRADYDSIVDILLSIDWDEILDHDDIDVAVQTFSNIVGYAIDRHVPKRTIKGSTCLPWQTPELRRLKTAKRAAFRKYSMQKGCVALRDYYVQINHCYKSASRRCYANYLHDVQGRLKSDPKSFWRHVNDQRKESGLPSSMVYGNNAGSNVQEICKLFSEKFASVFSNETLTSQQINSAAQNVPLLGESLNSIEIDDSMILTAIADLKPSGTVGPDGIPAVFLKKCSIGVLTPLRRLFRLSLTSGVFPAQWKSAFIFPVHKKGDKRKVDNYRGISALNSMSKLFEKVVLETIFNHCKQYISETQHGFMPKRSTTTNLLSFTTFVTDSMSQGLQTDAIYTDLSAAFDKINHAIMIAKLERLGFGGCVLRWMESYLVHRRLTVKIGDCTSAEFVATSGIPQGSHLGPLIFLLYFNDVNFSLDGPRLSFADDLKIYFQIRNIDDSTYLQGQLEVFSGWCDTNRMVLNPSKCSIISFTRKKKPIHYEYHLAETLIKREDCVKDLGVLLDSQLTYKQHISFIVAKASRSLGFIMRMTKSFNDVYCLKALYCSLVRSTLEYCSPIWNPSYMNGVERIEAIQRRFVRFALRRLPWRNPQQLPRYESRGQLIGLDTLHARRDLSCAMLISDLLTAKTDCPEILSAINFHARPRALRNSVFLNIPFRRTNYGAYSAVIGLQRLFNRVSSGFDFHLSRTTIRNNFLNLIRNYH